MATPVPKPVRAIAARASEALERFLRLEAAGGLLLIGAAILAMLIANSPLARWHVLLLETPFGIRLGEFALDKPLLLWINDGLMAVFFLLVGLEIKREVVRGQLSHRSQLALPLVCAFGGMVVPALVFAAFVRGDAEAMRGWTIPVATDIAFALGILSLLGSRVPPGLKILLTAIAVIDDLGAIVLIAFLYSGDLAWGSLAAAGVALLVLVAMNRLRVGSLTPYMLVGFVMWVAVLKSGVHATLAGVLLGLAIPISHPTKPDHSPLESLEEGLHPWVAYGILPLFAFANAGVPIAGGSGAGPLMEPVALGVMLGLVLGKPVGVFIFGWLATRFRGVELPQGVSATGLLGAAVLCGIGFTMSLFLGTLAFEHTGDDLGVPSRLGVLVGSTVSATAGYLLLRRFLGKDPAPA
ncbi:MAG: Na+/H+ antiporter NhaA [Fimbriimonadaceae bacterium]|nr:Na+/H+ antiporter NhaA [Chthonomonadaceae bacterium]MCO5296923.1 Na+/H+ antiporter NhaA [Fimbriimonadaceae bacterium]